MGLIKPSGTKLPTLSNPASATQILKNYDAINASGAKVTGSHVCPSAPTLPTLTKAATGSQIMSGYDAINSAMERVQGTHVCKTLSELLPSRSNPAGAEQIMSGYQGISNSGAVVNGSYVPPAAGAEYELITVHVSYGTKTVYHSLNGITHAFGVPASVLEYSNGNNSGYTRMFNDTTAFYGSSGGTIYKKDNQISYNDGAISTAASNGFCYIDILCVYDESEGTL